MPGEVVVPRGSSLHQFVFSAVAGGHVLLNAFTFHDLCPLSQITFTMIVDGLNASSKTAEPLILTFLQFTTVRVMALPGQPSAHV